MNRRKSIGPSTDPWGTPLTTGTLSDELPSTTTLWVRPDRKDAIQGPISSTGLRRVFVLKTSYEVRTLKIRFHQTIELSELLTFCRIFKTNI